MADRGPGVSAVETATHRHAPEALRAFAASLFRAAGMEADKAEVAAAVLVEADMLGHDTHGLALATRYLDEIASGGMAVGARRRCRRTAAPASPGTAGACPGRGW